MRLLRSVFYTEYHGEKSTENHGGVDWISVCWKRKNKTIHSLLYASVTLRALFSVVLRVKKTPRRGKTYLWISAVFPQYFFSISAVFPQFPH